VLEPIVHLTVPTPSISKVVVPSPKITRPVVGVIDVKNFFSLNMWKFAPLSAMMGYFMVCRDCIDGVEEDFT
jgi:hypothetical protein